MLLACFELRLHQGLCLAPYNIVCFPRRLFPLFGYMPFVLFDVCCMPYANGASPRGVPWVGPNWIHYWGGIGLGSYRLHFYFLLILSAPRPMSCNSFDSVPHTVICPQQMQSQMSSVASHQTDTSCPMSPLPPTLSPPLI